MYTLCGYYRALCFRMCCKGKGPKQLTHVVTKKADCATVASTTTPSPDKILPAGTIRPTPTLKASEESKGASNPVVQRTVTASEILPSLEPTFESEVASTPALPKASIGVSPGEVAPPIQPSSNVEQLITENLQQPVEVKDAQPQTDLESTMASRPCEVGVAQSQGHRADCTAVGPDPVQLRPQTDSVLPEADSNISPDAQTQEVADKADSQHPEVPGDIPADSERPDSQNADAADSAIPEKQEPQLNLTNGLKDIYAEEPSPVDSDVDLEAIAPPAGDELQYQKLTSGKKETTYMRLKNRIKALELHLNLSSRSCVPPLSASLNATYRAFVLLGNLQSCSFDVQLCFVNCRYLEELSQRYKEEMDQMHSSLNKTINKLANTSRNAEAKVLFGAVIGGDSALHRMFHLWVKGS